MLESFSGNTIPYLNWYKVGWIIMLRDRKISIIENYEESEELKHNINFTVNVNEDGVFRNIVSFV